MRGYRIYNDEAQLRGLIEGPFGLYIFISTDVDQPVLSDPLVAVSVESQGPKIEVDPEIWTVADGAHRGMLVYQHELVVDNPDSSVLMVRDLWTAQKFNDSNHGLSGCPR